MINKKNIILLIVIPVFLYIGFYIFWNFEHVLVTSISPKKNNTLIIKYITPFSFGEHKVKILYGSKKFFIFSKKTFITYLDNKGMALNKSNYKIHWVNDNISKIQLIGYKPAKTKTYKINFKTDKIVTD